MGLDISAYRRIEASSDYACDEQGNFDDWDNFLLVTGAHFPDHIEGLEDGGVYTYGTDSYGFRAGSYSGYNHFRNELAQMAGFEAADGRHAEAAWASTEGPFWELINFSDCEGKIGPVVSAKLLKDFQAFDEKARLKDEDFYEVYKDFTRAFTLAADHGLVDFH